MGRKARPGLGTVLKFIALDDDAIGGDSATIGTRYAEYIQTTNHRCLEVNLDKAPAYYYLRPLDTQQMQMLQGILSELRFFMLKKLEDSTKQKEGERPDPLTPEEKERQKQLDLDYQVLRESILDGCLIGCVNHKIVTSVNDDGDTEFNEVQWAIGTPRPEGLINSIKNDMMMIDNIIHFLVRAASLTEKEKKQ